MKTVLIEGGLHLASGKVGVRPGTLSDCVNYERSIRQGATRIEGYELFDGGTSVSYTEQILLGSTGWDDAVVGDVAQLTIEMPDSSEEIINVLVVQKFTNFVGIIFLSQQDSDLYVQEAGKYTQSTILGALSKPGDWSLLFQGVFQPTTQTVASTLSAIPTFYTLTSANVQPVPGQGEVIGLHWFKDRLHAIRDYYTIKVIEVRQFPRQGDELEGEVSGAKGIVAYVEPVTGVSGGSDLTDPSTLDAIIGLHSVTGTFAASEQIVNNSSLTTEDRVGRKENEFVTARGAGMYRADGERGTTLDTQSWQHIDTGWEVSFKEGDVPFTRYNIFASEEDVEVERKDQDSVPGDYESGGRWAVANFTNIQTDDNNNMACQVQDHIAGTQVVLTPELLVNDFGFDIPETAFILGIEARVKRKATLFQPVPTANDFAVDELVRLTLGPENKAKSDLLDTTNPATTPTNPEIYGSPADKWGTNPRPDDINATEFGLRLQYRMSYDGASTGVSPGPGPAIVLFWVEVTVYFLPGSSRVYFHDGTTDVEADVLNFITRRGTFAGSPKANGTLTLVNIDGSRTIGGNEQIRTEPLGAGTLLALTDGEAYKPVLPSEQMLLEASQARYQFENSNFYAKEGRDAIYGVHGVGSGFMWDGQFFGRLFVPIPVEEDKPRHVAAFQGRLVLGYGSGYAAFSALRLPLVYDGAEGADEQYFQDPITGLLPLNGQALCFGTRRTVQILKGSDPQDWQIEVISPNSGMIEYTFLDMGEFVFLDFRGLANLSAVDRYGDFARGRLSDEVWPLLRPRLQLSAQYEGRLRGPACVVPVRNKNQYRVSFADGLVLSASFVDQGAPHFYTSRYTDRDSEPVVWSVLCSGVQAEGKDRVFGAYRGSNGFVYELDRGNSFDGAAINASFNLNVDDFDIPYQIKKFEYIHAHAVAKGYANVTVGRAADYNEPSTAPFSMTFGSLTALWTNTDQTYFDKAEMILEGRGISIRFQSQSNQQFPHTIQAVSIQAQRRNQERA